MADIYDSISENKGDTGTSKVHNIYKRFTTTVVSDFKKVTLK